MTGMPAPTRASPPRRQDASMLLLTNLMEHALDDGYAEAAARRGDQAAPKRPGWLLVVGLLAAGLLLSTAAAQTRDRASSTAEARTALVSEIESRDAANDRIEAELQQQRDQVAAARRRALRLTAEGQALAATLSTLEVATGAGAVTGPAFVIHLDDAPTDQGDGADVDPRTDAATDGRLTDRDLQTIVNEVWAAGAEAVAVNGQRLTTLSAIRSAGDAVLVDFRPLSPPYDVVGVGDSDAMRAAFAEGFGGSYLQALRDYGISYSMDTKDRVRLAASSGVMLRYATDPAETETSS
jgi:uncharacterized protein YlxW (UPF0749 family)